MFFSINAVAGFNLLCECLILFVVLLMSVKNSLAGKALTPGLVVSL